MKKNDILIKIKNDPLNNMTADEVVEKLTACLQDRVSAAYFFGSFRTERFHKFSDIDVILVHSTSTPFVERALAFSDLLDILPDMDILVYTPEEFQKLTTDPSQGFWARVTRELTRFI